ncbi:prepilin-type N-terminal cleavage/methylation domain-containing protein [Bacteriovorax sp. PP10]|uniref:Prepilin-type N-terminal cleavage/methylation domain-containing protein n=1 Tax=Bacteriovorax antarcticus TaxID=3088717 RepID=A0ABU5VWL8_9BACT|nr:prepilin-type N-terminal cleavage/methylation domain-containing protein [Bacteriovorax sp. PP10]MEA9356025.1 prepilin-type N-terminal cleavage/methylation domain-containing protein [Bacteriovorax sp. PP10]
MVNKGFSFVEVMVSVAILAIGVVAFINMSKVDSNSNKQVVSQDAKAYITKELLTSLESKANCETLLKNKAVGANLNFLSTDGINITAGTVINKTHRIAEFKYKFLSAPNLPSEYKFINIYFVLSPISDATKKVIQNIRIIGKASSTVSSCVSPREDGGLLVQQKAIQIAKVKVCTEDLKGTLQASGVCSWPEPFTTIVVPIQL